MLAEDDFDPDDSGQRGDIMKDLRTWAGRWEPYLLSVLRIVTAFLFLAHGGQKLFGFPTPLPFQLKLFSLMGLAGLLEFGGGLLLFLGVFTRPVAFLLSGEMAVAYFAAHAPKGFWPLLNQGELAVLYCFIFLFLAAAGGGAWSLDQLLVRSKTGPEAKH